jgi:hypothetical protein
LRAFHLLSWSRIVLTPARTRLIVALFCVAMAARAQAQVLPESPLRSPDGRLVVSAELTATIGSQDDTAFFNYTDYEHNALRMLRLGTSGVWRPTGWLALAGEIRSEDLEHPSVYAAYARVRPWRSRNIDIQAGRIPPTFGAFGKRAYNTDNPVIGYPLAYQYLTSLRSDAVPASAEDVLRMRGRGWRSNFPVGDPTPGPGLPLISGFRWDTGVQVRWKAGPVEVTSALTQGTLSNPRLSDDNSGKQLSGRVTVTPAVGLVIGVSGAGGAWLSRRVPGGDGSQQRAFGADIEYSRDHWILHGEMVFSRWSVPLPLTPSNAQSLSALGTWVEGKYRLTPRIFVAGRADRLGFSQLQGSTATLPWDAPVTRFEAGAGYYLQRNLVARATVQSNRRSGGRVTERSFVSAQLAYWF